MNHSSRREFLAAAAVTTAATAQSAAVLPTVNFRGKDITRLIIGSNPFYGYGHSVPLLDRFMREYMTQDQRIAILKAAERGGINTWQVHYNDPTVEDWKRYRAEGGKMNVLLLADFDLMKNYRKLIPEVAKLGPIGIAHHGGVTDNRFRNREMNLVEDFTKAVHDGGVPAGVSTHNPAVVAYVEEKDWKIDFYMTCMYRVSRTVEETRTELGGEAPLGEVFMEKDPERMCKMVRQTKRTCFAFKLMGAGRNVSRPQAVESAFRFVLRNIKPQDPVIVGMCPKFKDEIAENAAFVSKICGERYT